MSLDNNNHDISNGTTIKLATDDEKIDAANPPQLLKSVSVYEDDDESEADSDEGRDRASWGGKLEFIFTCIGYAVGLGNVWRFPYLAYKNGGGAFLIPYVFMLSLVGLPLFFMELSFGQFASLGPISIWKINPLFKGLGYAMICCSWFVGIYYNVIISHVMLFFFATLASIPNALPWSTCTNPWNTEHCLTPDYDNSSSINKTISYELNLSNNATVVTTARLVTTPSEEYYNHYVLEISDGIEFADGVNWKLCLCLLLCWIIVLACLIKGISSLGKVVYFTAIFPYFMLTILLVRGLTLPGAMKGILFYITPDFNKLIDPRVWADAASQIFYSLGTCTGGLIAMASYNKFQNNCARDAVIVALVNCATSIYAGLVIFCVLGFMAEEKGVDIAHVATGGPGLAFIVYPEALARMPVPHLWSVCFFIMMASLGFGSQFSIIEAVLSALSDEFASVLKNKWQSYTFRTIIIVISFLMGVPMVSKGGIYLLNLVDYSVSGFPLLVIGLFECIALNWIYGFSRFSDDISMMLGKSPNIYWKATWCVLTPAVITLILFFNFINYKSPTYDDYTYPDWAVSLGILIGIFPILLIAFFFIYRLCLHGGYRLVKKRMHPNPEWGPGLPENRSGVYTDYYNQPMTPNSAVSGVFSFGFNPRKPLNIVTVLTTDDSFVAQDLDFSDTHEKIPLKPRVRFDTDGSASIEGKLSNPNTSKKNNDQSKPQLRIFLDDNLANSLSQSLTDINAKQKPQLKLIIPDRSPAVSTENISKV